MATFSELEVETAQMLTLQLYETISTRMDVGQIEALTLIREIAVPCEQEYQQSLSQNPDLGYYEFIDAYCDKRKAEFEAEFN